MKKQQTRLNLKIKYVLNNEKSTQCCMLYFDIQYFLLPLMKQVSPTDLLDDGGILQLSLNESEDYKQYPKLSDNDQFNQSIMEDDLAKPIGVKRSSFLFQESFRDTPSANINLEQSFGDLENSTREEPMFKSKLGKTSAIRDSSPAKQRDTFDFNQSIYTERRDNHLGLNRASQQKYQEETLANNHYQSLDMQPNIPQSSFQFSSSSKKQKEDEYKISLKSTNYFLQAPNGDSVMINAETLRDLYDEFFKAEIFIPHFKYSQYDEWNQSKDKFNPELESHRILKVSLQRYIKYICRKYPQKLESIFKTLEEIQRGRIQKKRQTNSFSLFTLDFTNILEGFKNYMSSSKTQILRKTLLAKIRSIRQQIQLISKTNNLHRQVEKMQNHVQSLWSNFGQIQLLLNFQQTEYYCTKKIENSSEPKFRQIWVRYRDFIREQHLLYANQAILI